MNNLTQSPSASSAHLHKDSIEENSKSFDTLSHSDSDINQEHIPDDESYNNSDTTSSPDIANPQTASTLCPEEIESVEETEKSNVSMPTIRLKLVNILTNSNQKLLQSFLGKCIAALKL